MHMRRHWSLSLLLAGLAACQSDGPTAVPEPDLHVSLNPVVTAAAGGGKFDVAVTGGGVGTFAFGAVGRADGSSHGALYFQLNFQGQHVEFQGTVTCVSVDRAQGRAWIGGVVTQNRSAHPSYTTPRTQPGRDIWFRILDHDALGSDQRDRTTFVGFEGDRGIITSAEYCQAQPWVDNNAGTWEVIKGNVALH
jgi:hypothetical protein